MGLSPLQTAIRKVGQTVLDEPVTAALRNEPMERSIADAFGRRPKLPITLGFERVRLKWVKPDGNGGWVPR